MTDPVPRAPGWHPDPETGGTRYSDGKRWTGDVRPPRRPFAAASANPGLAGALIAIGVGFFALGMLGFTEEETSVLSKIALFFVGLVVMTVTLGFGVYLLRGQGPTTEEVKARLAAEEKEAKAKRRAANVAGFAASLGGLGRSKTAQAPTDADLAAAAQIDALTRPETARALQNLQHLLYTRAITDAEFQAAKDKLFVQQAPVDVFVQIEKLAELHEAGILGDIEFSAAKARVLGL